MKKGLKLLFASLVCCTLMLAGCSKPAPTPTPEVVHVTGISTTEEGFSYDEDYEAYMNSMYCFIYAVVEEGSTYLVLN